MNYTKETRCPYLHGRPDSVDVCSLNKMRPCVYETDDLPCPEFPEDVNQRTVDQI